MLIQDGAADGRPRRFALLTFLFSVLPLGRTSLTNHCSNQAFADLYGIHVFTSNIHDTGGSEQSSLAHNMEEVLLVRIRPNTRPGPPLLWVALEGESRRWILFLYQQRTKKLLSDRTLQLLCMFTVVRASNI